MHGKYKAFCLLCGGSGLCQHARKKSYCKTCRGSSYCEHGKQKQVCKACGGSALCLHNKRKERCKACGGSAYCEHGKFKHNCPSCGKIPRCSHGKQKGFCRACGGFAFCIHNKRKDLCLPCGGKQFCPSCRLIIVQKRGTLCFSCQPTPSVRSLCPEIRLAGILNQWADDGKISKYTAWNKQNPLADPLQCGKYRVDFTFEMPSGVVLLECDEKQHSEYVKRCELVRQAEVSLGFGGLPVHWIRYNPDAFKINGTTRVTKREERESTLLRHLQLVLTRPDYEHFVTVTYICYDNPGSTNADPDALVQTKAFKTVEDYNMWVEKSS